jgi:hypothetical protein
MKKSKSAISAAAGLLAIAGSLVVVWRVALPWSWMWVAIFMVVFMMVLGTTISGRLLGILITEQNVMSLARFQAVLWTVIVISAFFVIAIARIDHAGKASSDGKPSDPLNITLSNELLALLGISATALVGSPLIAATKKSKKPDQSDPQITTGDRADAGTIGIANAEGILFKNADINAACFTDIFEGDELANNNHVDLGKVQMFYFTVVTAVAYIAVIWKTIGTPDTLYSANFTFPALSAGAVALLGISNAGYLANKGVDHTKKQTPP